jgi:hypothetical protein
MPFIKGRVQAGIYHPDTRYRIQNRYRRLAISTKYFKTEDGLVIGIYNYQKGSFLINSFDLIGNIGQPDADRIILNILKYGQADNKQIQDTGSVHKQLKSP